MKAILIILSIIALNASGILIMKYYYSEPETKQYQDLQLIKEHK